MDDVSEEASSEGCLLAKKKKKPSFFQKVRRTWVCLIQPLRASCSRSKPRQGLQANIGVRRKLRIGDLFRRKRHAHRERSDQWPFYRTQDQSHNRKHAQQFRNEKNRSPMHFHFPHPKIRFHFHVPYPHNSHSHSHQVEFHENSTKHKDVSHSRAFPKDVPKGFLPVYVGEEHQRFVIPVFYLNHPLFGDLLKGTEEEFGFEHKGALLIPCEVSDFELLRSRIGRKHSCKSRTSHCGTNMNDNREEHGDLQCLLT